MIAYVTNVDAYANTWNVKVALRDNSNGNVLVGPVVIPFSFPDYTTWEELRPLLATPLNQYCVDNGVTPPSSITWMIPTMEQLSPMMSPTASSETRSIVTGTGATGFQVSATRNAVVDYSATIVSTSTIAGSQVGTVVLEVAPTNSATAGDWVEVGRITNGQALSLAITLQSVQTYSGRLGGFIPAGYYAKLRSINASGTPSYSYNSGRKVLY